MDPSPTGDLVRAADLEAAAQTLLERAKQIRTNVSLGLSWTCHPAKHGERSKIGEYNGPARLLPTSLTLLFQTEP